MENTEEKVCTNCKHYVERYIKFKHYYRAVGGYCTNRNLRKALKQKCSRIYCNCEQWESDDIKKAERKENIKKVLSEMNEHLRQIEFILKADE